jgi:hypothetical protein
MDYVHVLFFLQEHFHLLFRLDQPPQKSWMGVPTKVGAVLRQKEFFC